MVSAYSEAGFAVEETSVLDKIQSSFKQVVSKVSVKGDPLLLLSKFERKDSPTKTVDMIFHEIVANTNSQNSEVLDHRMLYSQFIARCLELEVPLEINAAEFYEKVELSLEHKYSAT